MLIYYKRSHPATERDCHNQTDHFLFVRFCDLQRVIPFAFVSKQSKTCLQQLAYLAPSTACPTHNCLNYSDWISSESIM